MSESLGFVCRRCGDCCRAIRVPITDVDLLRLVRATGRTPDDIVEWLRPDDIEMSGEPETFVRLPEGRRLMVLRHVEGGCRFLLADRCSVHPARPTACAAFPFFVERDGRIGHLEGSCEPDAVPPLAGLEPTSRRLAVELERFALRVQAYNRIQRGRLRLHRRPLPAARFFSFLI